LLGAPSDLELKLDDLESLEDFDITSFGEGSPPAEGPSSEVREPGISQGTMEAESNPLAPSTPDRNALASEGLSSQWQMDSGLWDEVATKLDLARAYLDMQDPDAAKVILDEVVEEGTDEQKDEAKQMLSRLD
jgi:pilus assembly protein FimV